MSETIELTKSDFANVIGFMLDPCSSLLPGERPIPGTVPPDPEGCKHWIEVLTLTQVADVAIDRVLSRQRDEASGDRESDAVQATNRAEVQRLVDDFCGKPPRWPLPWPQPRRPLDPAGLSAIQLLAVGVRFQAAADHVQDNALQPALAMAADQLLDAGLSRLAASRTDGP